MTPVLRVTDVEFGYHPGKPVLRDISFEVSPGEVFIILGANGCGKSTLMRTILGEHQPTSGSITIGGDKVTSLGVKQLAQRMAMVFQDHSAPFPFTVLDVVKMGRTPHLPPFGSPTRKDQAICLEALETVGLRDLALEPYTQLSGGERQRVAIARAILKDAPVLILDEATSAADPENQALIDAAIENLCEGKTVLIVAHRLDVVPSCDAVAVVEDGHLTSVGSHRETLERSPYYRGAWDAYQRSRSMSYRVGAADSGPDASGNDDAGIDGTAADDEKGGPSHV